MKRPRWDKGGDGSAISNVGLPPSGCGKRSSKRGTAKLRKNCDAHTYKRRPVNSMDPLPPRCARFQSVSSLPFLLSYFSKAIGDAYTYTNGAATVRMHVTGCLTSAQVHGFLRERYRDGLRQRKKRELDKQLQKFSFSSTKNLPFVNCN